MEECFLDFSYRIKDGKVVVYSQCICTDGKDLMSTVYKQESLADY